MNNIQLNGKSKNMSNGSEWQIFKEQCKGVLGNMYEMPGVKRADGMSVIYETAVMRNTIGFLVKGGFGEFRFAASRWDNARDIPTDTYIVHLNFFQKNWLGNDPSNKLLIKRFSKDIESALLSYPILHGYNDIPVREVLFDIRNVNEPRHLVHAGEF